MQVDALVRAVAAREASRRALGRQRYWPPLARGRWAGHWLAERRHRAAAVLQRAVAEARLRRPWIFVWCTVAGRRERRPCPYNEYDRRRAASVALAAQARCIAHDRREAAATQVQRAALRHLYVPGGAMMRLGARAVERMFRECAAPAEDGAAPPRPPPPAEARGGDFDFTPFERMNAEHLIRLAKQNRLDRELLDDLCRGLARISVGAGAYKQAAQLACRGRSCAR